MLVAIANQVREAGGVHPSAGEAVVIILEAIAPACHGGEADGEVRRGAGRTGVEETRAAAGVGQEAPLGFIALAVVVEGRGGLREN